MTTLADVTAELDRAARLIGAARDVVGGGKAVDLSGLDDVVMEACGNIAALPEDQRQTLKPVLISLIDSLNGLVEALNVQRGEIATEIRDVNSRSHATAAYGKGAASAKPGGRK
jgi:hypothetical protein